MANPPADFRIQLWDAVRHDNAQELLDCLQTWSDDDIHGFLADTKRSIWKPGNLKPWGLLEVCCVNHRGVPEAGSPRCAQLVKDLMQESMHREDLQPHWQEWVQYAELRYEGLPAHLQAQRQWVAPLLAGLT